MKIYLAPMEGITTYIYRNAYHKYYGGIDTYYTPFVANRTLKSRELRDVLPENNTALPLVPQILTNKTDVFLEIIEQLKDMGYNEVNFNLGCPSGTVVAKGRGAGFLDDPTELEKFLDIIYDKSPLPISIKTRLGIESLYEWEDLLKMYAKFPIKELIVHARTLSQQYGGTPHMEAFKMAQDMLSCPLCYNGDITDTDTYGKLLKECPDTTAVMIGRGAIADPELPVILKHSNFNFNQFCTSSTDNNEKIFNNNISEWRNNFMDYSKFLSFHDEILTGYRDYMSGEQPVLYKMKELWTLWSQHRNVDKKILKKIRKAQSISAYQSIVKQIYFNGL
ncbi:MAG: tRNA-dihydrouridine synthase family protein [Lachnospiraceae bacterium]|nr:tRNA-dihydrouridine synthase family protein [Lachnospiraceae bacterium]